MTLTIKSTGILNGKAVVWSYDEKSHEFIIPTDAITMAKLAEAGIPVRTVTDIRRKVKS